MATFEQANAQISQSGKFVRVLKDHCTLMALLPCLQAYQRDTLLPIIFIIEKETEVEVHYELAKCFKIKIREAQYVQVAGAILFTSTISCLSWNNFSDCHWSAPALWYAGILFALTSIMLGAQQTLMIPDESEVVDALTVQNRLTTNKSLPRRPNCFMLFVLQAPVTCLSYAIMFFLGGLGSVVFSPLAQNSARNGQY
ncbi:hypothetical protein MMC28_006656 [Mycoblastus sanguinarius]|nr:hypothetical protein [Mycoblastus sanguinarius]